MFIPLAFAFSMYGVNSYLNSTVVKVAQADKAPKLVDNYANIAWYESDLFGF